METKKANAKANPREKVYYNSNYCNDCNPNDCVECNDCIQDLSTTFYHDFRKIAPKADKILVVAYNSNWQGKTGYLVVDFNHRSLSEILNKTTSFNKKIYRDGRNMLVFASSHDVPTGSKWLLKPICSKGMRNDLIIQKAMKLYG